MSSWRKNSPKPTKLRFQNHAWRRCSSSVSTHTVSFTVLTRGGRGGLCCLWLCLSRQCRYLSIEQTNRFRQRPSHRATGCQSFRFGVKTFSRSSHAGGPKEFFFTRAWTRSQRPWPSFENSAQRIKPSIQFMTDTLWKNLLKGMNQLDWSFDARKIGACCMTMHHHIRLVLVTPQCHLSITHM